jgi:pyruvate dehydrogenase E1 component beta subunit
MTFNFSLVAIDQIINGAAKINSMSGGQYTAPIVFRGPTGNAGQLGAQHSQNFENWYVNIPGLKVVIPSNPSRAYGLMLAAIRDPDPVIFLEPKRIYRIEKHEIEDNGEDYPLGMCFVDREGTDITLISWGAMLYETKQAAEKLAEQGIDAEVIDVATVSPLDIDTILESVEKTGRVCIVQEAPKAGALGSEIAAEIAEKQLMSLLAPIGRVSGYDTVIPYYRLEKHFMPKVDHIIDEAKRLMEYK